MKKEIQQILRDVYRLDPSLKEHETVLVEIIEKLMAAKPDIKIDRVFVSNLKKRLQTGESIKPSFSLFGFPKLAYTLGALALVALGVFSFNYFSGDEPGELVLETGIENVGEKAFGDIVFSAEQATEEGALGRGGGGVPAGSTQNLAAPLADAEKGTIDTKSVPYKPRRINYEFVYAGENISVDEETMNVYKRAVGDSIGSKLAGLLSGVELDSVDLGKFRNAQVSSLQINEDRNQGYSIFIDPKQGMVALSMNWEKWPQDVYQKQMTEADRLSDEQALSIAADFVRSYGIKTDKYGEPEVLDYAGHYYALEESGTSSYIPDSRSVVYPLLIDGKAVYDQSGRKTGMNMEVSARYRKVTYAGNIFAGGFQSSQYEVETNAEKIISSAEQGGMSYYYQHSDPTETVQMELGTPSLQLVRVWQMTENKYLGEELYVPAFVFPLTDQSDKERFYQEAVVVSLVGIETSQGGVRPMPLLEEEEAVPPKETE